MSEDRRQILQMLADGKVTPEEAERLLAAFDPPLQSTAVAPGAGPSGARPKYLRVVVDAEDAERGEGPVKVNIRVPMQLLRAGVRLGALMPPVARDQVNAALQERGVPFDVGQLKPENLEDLVEHLNDLTIDVDNDKAKVRVFCE